jgi:IS5 family transposase
VRHSKKGNQWHFGMEAHVGVDAESGLVHTVIGSPGNINDVVPANSLLHGEETTAFADSGYRGAHKRPDAKPSVTWQIAVRPSDRQRLKAGANLRPSAPSLTRSRSSRPASVRRSSTRSA